MSNPFIGEIRLFAGNFAPQGWAFCDGQLLPISENEALFTLIGTTYGGDGQSTFALPDLRGRIPIHMGQGPGRSNRELGENGGAETVTLTVTQMPGHIHPSASTNTATLGDAAGHVLGATGTTPIYVPETSPPTSDLSAQAVRSSGGSQPHNNLMPYQGINFIIALFGIFPSRN